jgi:hypothetical protein
MFFYQAAEVQEARQAAKEERKQRLANVMGQPIPDTRYADVHASFCNVISFCLLLSI